MLKMTRIKKMVMAMGLMALIGSACAERIVSVDLDVYMNDSVVLHALRVEDGNPTKYVRPGEYEAAIDDGSGNALYNTTLNLDYVLYSDPPREMNPAPLGLRVRYDPGMKRLRLLKAGRPIFSQDLKICDDNGICDTAFESYLTCPGDCRLDRIDGMCIKSGDGACDPDCMSGADPDCANRLPAISDFFPYLLGAAALSVVLVYAAGRRKKGRTVT